ncbi:MAG TPA: type II secretion system protein GspN [Candidatus Binataceae bacterium]|nr:type II secretion system protein GspN [Candidatus Binataceae bacterium]
MTTTQVFEFVREFVRAHRTVLAYVGFGAILFFAFLLATFPYADTLSGVLAPMGLRLTMRDQGVSFPFGIRLDGVVLDSPDGKRQLFKSDSLRVTPAYLSMLLGTPGVSISADAYGGSFDLHARRSGDATTLSFSGASLHLENYPALRAMGLNLRATLSGDGNAYVTRNDLFADRGVFHVDAAGASYQIFPGSRPLKLGEITASIHLDQGKLTIDQVDSHGGDLSISGRGVIELQPNLPDSTVAIKFQLATTPAGRATLGFLLNFLPHPPNAGPYFLSGTLAFPRLS